MDVVQITNRHGDTITLSKAVVTSLASQLHGPLLSVGDADYEGARKIWNGMIDKHPALVVRCHGVADVMAAVNFVRDHQLLFSVRAGGHNVSGAAIADGGVVIDVSQMRSVHVDPQKNWL